MNAFNEYRKVQTTQVEYFVKALKACEMVEPVLPAFIGNRYRIESVYEDSGYGTTAGRYSIILNPDLDKAPKGKPDSLHADVTKLFEYLRAKRHIDHMDDGHADVLVEPTRAAQSWGGVDGAGSIRYRMVVSHIPELGGKHLEVNFHGIPAGTKCEVIKTPRGEPRHVQDYDYELKCDS